MTSDAKSKGGKQNTHPHCIRMTDKAYQALLSARRRLERLAEMEVQAGVTVGPIAHMSLSDTVDVLTLLAAHRLYAREEQCYKLLAAEGPQGVDAKEARP